jgi:Prophage CP4-57 regulatory protein (AlpA)
VPPIPPEQSAEHSTPLPRGPHDHDTRPHGRTKHQPAVQRDNQSGEAASPHQRQGDRGSGDDSAARRALPVFVRYADLVAAGIVANWTTLLRLIDDEQFPRGVMLSPNIRAWRLDEVEAWLETRPVERKPVPTRWGGDRRRTATT